MPHHYIIEREWFLGNRVPTVSIIKQGEFYIATGDNGHLYGHQDIEFFAGVVSDIIIGSLLSAWRGKKVRIYFKGDSKEVVDFWIERGLDDKFSLILKSEGPKEEESQKFLKVFCSRD